MPERGTVTFGGTTIAYIVRRNRRRRPFESPATAAAARSG
jgi:hypothetical protein